MQQKVVIACWQLAKGTVSSKTFVYPRVLAKFFRALKKKTFFEEGSPYGFFYTNPKSERRIFKQDTENLTSYVDACRSYYLIEILTSSVLLTHIMLTNSIVRVIIYFLCLNILPHSWGHLFF